MQRQLVAAKVMVWLLNSCRIENVHIEQGVFARMLDYGTVMIVGTGGTRQTFRFVAAPLEFRRAVHEQADAHRLAG